MVAFLSHIVRVRKTGKVEENETERLPPWKDTIGWITVTVLSQRGPSAAYLFEFKHRVASATVFFLLDSHGGS